MGGRKSNTPPGKMPCKTQGAATRLGGSPLPCLGVRFPFGLLTETLCGFNPLSGLYTRTQEFHHLPPSNTPTFLFGAFTLENLAIVHSFSAPLKKNVNLPRPQANNLSQGHRSQPPF